MQIRFSRETKYGIFSDALNLPDDHSYSEQEIEAMQQQRVDAWVAFIDGTQADNTIEPTLE